MTDYARILRDVGLRVSATPGWQRRSAPGAPPAPVGVLTHHTAARSSAANPAPSVSVCVEGRPDLTGPLCHVLIGLDGTCHIIAAGRAHHAGQATASGPNPAGDGNTLYVGIELDYSGDEPPSPEQYRTAVSANAAILRHMGRPAEAARGHRETSVTGKIDPGHLDLDRFRADIAAAINGSDAHDGGIESMALDTRFRDWAGNEQHVQGWMDNVDRRLAALHHVLLEPGSEPSRIPGDHNRTNLRDMIMDTGAWTHRLLSDGSQPRPDSGTGAPATRPSDPPPSSEFHEPSARIGTSPTTSTPPGRTHAPNRKITADGLAGAASAITIWILSLYEIATPEHVSAAITLLVTAGASYLVPERQ